MLPGWPIILWSKWCTDQILVKFLINNQLKNIKNSNIFRAKTRNLEDQQWKWANQSYVTVNGIWLCFVNFFSCVGPAKCNGIWALKYDEQPNTASFHTKFTISLFSIADFYHPMVSLFRINFCLIQFPFDVSFFALRFNSSLPYPPSPMSHPQPPFPFGLLVSFQYGLFAFAASPFHFSMTYYFISNIQMMKQWFDDSRYIFVYNLINKK